MLISRRVSQHHLWLLPGLVFFLLAASPRPVAAQEADPAPATIDRTFGIRVLGGGDRVANIVGALGGVRVDGLEKGTLARSVRHPDVRRFLTRGDFILRIRVEGIDPEPERGAPTFDTVDAFVAECDRVRSVVAALPERRATLLFDVFTQAGYNLEDWKNFTYEAELQL